MQSPETLSYILATAGHVDHGKSALVTALTGTDPDRLPEEKARGITIDLGFAHMALEAEGRRFSVGVVDVPGHEDFVRNMVAGIGSVDLALLVVAADDGWMPQTEEHLQILEYLGVRRAVVAMTKADLLAEANDVARAAGEIRKRLAGSGFAEARIVPTSVMARTGLEELRAALAEALMGMQAPVDVGKPRLPVDRAFTLPGVGTVVTGTLAGGTLRKGQAVVVQPGATGARVRSIQSHGRAAETAGPGARVALNLPDLQVRSGDDARGAASVGRGDVVTIAELGPGTDTVDVLIWRSGRVDADAAGRVLRDGARVYVHHGSAAVAARVCLLDAEGVGSGGAAAGQLRLEGRLFALAGDRLVIRDWPQRETLAGGIVLDPDAARRGFRSAERRAFLAARAAEPGSVQVYVRSLLARDGVAVRGTVGVRSNFAGGAIEKALREMVGRVDVVDVAPLVAGAGYWKSVVDRAVGAVDAHHLAHPEQAGMPLEQLRALVRGDVFDPLVRHLTENGFVRSGAAVRRGTHLPKLPPRLQQAGDRLRRRLAEAGFDPPSVNQLAPDDLSRQALKFLLISGEAVQLTADVVLASEALARAAGIVREEIRRRGPATVSRLKTALASSRRVMVPLLERLDRDRVTRREGDLRVLGDAR